MLNRVREAVSADRRRFKDASFNLDLSYVTPRIIAMAIPSVGIQAAYRNHMDDVDAFLRSYHGENFMIWNLSEFSYDAKFSDKVIHLPFPDHHPPPLDLYLKLVEMMSNWLRADDNHVAVVHCKGGKGRTGTIVVSLLLFIGECSTITEAEELFATMRSAKAKGVTQPSQRRYIQYFKTILLQDRLINYQYIRLRSVTIAALISGRPILLQLFNGVTDDAQLLYSQMKTPINFDESSAMVNFNIELDVRGDLYFKVLRKKDKEKVERCFHVVVHSFFIASSTFILERKDLDHMKDADKRFSSDLTVTFQFGVPESADKFPEKDDLHERMANRFQTTLDDTSRVTPAQVTKRKTARKYRVAFGELHSHTEATSVETSSTPVYDHPLLRNSVKLGKVDLTRSGEESPSSPGAIKRHLPNTNKKTSSISAPGTHKSFKMIRPTPPPTGVTTEAVGGHIPLQFTNKIHVKENGGSKGPADAPKSYTPNPPSGKLLETSSSSNSSPGQDHTSSGQGQTGSGQGNTPNGPPQVPPKPESLKTFATRSLNKNPSSNLGSAIKDSISIDNSSNDQSSSTTSAPGPTLGQFRKSRRNMSAHSSIELNSTQPIEILPSMNNSSTDTPPVNNSATDTPPMSNSAADTPPVIPKAWFTAMPSDRERYRSQNSSSSLSSSIYTPLSSPSLSGSSSPAITSPLEVTGRFLGGGTRVSATIIENDFSSSSSSSGSSDDEEYFDVELIEDDDEDDDELYAGLMSGRIKSAGVIRFYTPPTTPPPSPPRQRPTPQKP